MEEDRNMKKSLFITIILPTAACVLLFIGVFIGRQTSGNRFALDKNGPPEATVAWINDGKININLADAQALQILPGIGAVIAQRIIDYRETHGDFTDINELRNVHGIGDGIFKNIADRITVD